MTLAHWYNLQLDRHYGDGGYRVTEAKYLLLAILCGFALVAAFVALATTTADIRTGFIITAAITVTSTLCLGVSFFAVINGRLRLAEHIIMAATTFAVLFGIACSGGIPESPSSPTIVVLPLLAFWFYETKTGGFVGIACIAYGSVQYMASSIYGVNILNHDFGIISPHEQGKFTSWLIGSCLILSPAFVIYSKTDSIKKLLKIERNKLSDLATLDCLTQVANVRGFYDKFDRVLMTASSDDAVPFSLVYLDLNSFKPINDAHGHEAGDVVLQVIAGRLLNCVWTSDSVARLGGDEFALLLSNRASTADVACLIERVREAVAAPIGFGKLTLHVTISIGAAHYFEDGFTREDLLQIADARMYEDKQRTRAGQIAQSFFV